MKECEARIWEGPRPRARHVEPDEQLDTLDGIAERFGYSEEHLLELLEKGDMEGVDLQEFWLTNERAVRAYEKARRGTRY